MAEFDRHVLDGAVDGQVQLLQSPRHLDRPALVAEMPLYLADDRGRGVGREFDAALDVEAVDRFDESDGADLDEVVDRFDAGGEPDGKIAGQIEERDGELDAEI